MRIQPFSAVFPNMELISSSDGFFSRVKEGYPEYRQSGYFSKKQPSALYAYQISKGDDIQNGLIAAVAMEDYLQERVKKHENTLALKEQKQLDLLLHRQASVKPVLLAHPHHQPLSDILGRIMRMAQPVHQISFESGELHRFWPITQPSLIQQIQHLFNDHIPQTYIADGHHRFSSAARLYQQQKKEYGTTAYNHLMCALFPTTQLQIHNFNRVVEAFDEISPLSFMASLSQYGKIEPLDRLQAPIRSHQLTFVVEREWFRLSWRPEVIARHAEVGLPVMDVSILNHCVLQDVLGFMDIRKDERIKYIEGPQGLKILERQSEKKGAAAFCLHPLSWQAFFRVINNGYVLPPKSTWFEPRMRNGLVVQVFE